MSAHCSSIRQVVSSRGLVSYEIELSHDGLHKHRIIRGNDPNFVQRKAAVQLMEWEEQWTKKLSMQARNQQVKLRYEIREEKKRIQEEKKQLAAERTKDAQDLLESLQNTLRYTLDYNDAIDWERLKDFSLFSKLGPTKQNYPQRPQLASVPREPLKTDPLYQPQLGLMDKLFSSRKERK